MRSRRTKPDFVPQAPTLDWVGPALASGGGGGELAGGPVASVTRQQPYVGRPAAWGIFVRAVVLDDAMYELVQIVPPRLAAWSLTEGQAGRSSRSPRTRRQLR
jgi:hypothetical protein